MITRAFSIVQCSDLPSYYVACSGCRFESQRYHVRYSNSTAFISQCRIPLVYYGTFDEEKTAAKLWNDAWKQNSATEQSSIRLYFFELLRILEPRFEETDWSVRQQAFACLSSAIKKLEQSDLEKDFQPLVTKVLQACKGKRWVG